MADTFLFAQLSPFTVYGAGASIGDATLTLSSMTDIDGNLLTMANFGTIAFGTIEPGNSSQEEQICFTGITQNANGTATLTGVKNVGFLAPYTQTANLAKSHIGGSQFIISNTSGFYDKLTGKSNDETVTGKWTFPGGGNANAPVSGTVYSAPTDSLEYASKGYVDGVAIAGAPKATDSVYGITKLSVAASVPAEPIAVGTNDTRVPPVNTSTLTAGEVAALVGQSGTAPAVTNKYEDYADTSTGLDQTQLTQNATVAVGEADATTKHAALMQSFVAGYASQTGVKLWKIANTGTFTGDVIVSLLADSGGSPTGGSLATVTIPNATWLTLPAGEFVATFSSPYTATPGTTYWYVITTSTHDNANHPNLGSNSAGGYANGSVKFQNSADGYVAIATIDLYFKGMTDASNKVIRTNTSGMIAKQLIDTGTSANQIVALGADAKLPAVDGSKLTNINNWKVSSTSFDTSTASGTQTIAHGLGRTPKFVRIVFRGQYINETNSQQCLTVTYDGSTTIADGYVINSTGTSTFRTTFTIYGTNSSGTQTGVITVDATNIYIAWTKASTPSGSITEFWEVNG